MRKRLLIVLLASLPPAAVSGADLRGLVRDATTGHSLRDVRVEIDDGVQLVSTNRAGEFHLAGLADRPHKLRIQHGGYELFEREVAAGAETPLELRLRPTALRLHETVVVSAGRDPVAGLDTPRSVSVLTAEDLARQVPRTTPEALLDTTGVWVQKTNHGGGSPFLRGLSGNQVLVLVDGVRLNNATFRYGPNQYLATVDPFSLERIELVRGIGSVLHGSDALGGVVSFFSARPEFSAGGTEVSGGLDTRLMSSGQERSGRVELQVSGRRAALLGGISLRDFGDVRAGGALGVEAPSGYGERDGDVKLAVRLASNHLFTAAYQHVHLSDVPRYDQVAQRGFSRYSFDPQVRQLAYAQLHSSFSSGWVESLSAVASFHRSDETRIRQQRGSTVTVTERDVVDAWGLSWQARTRPAAGWTLVWGGEAYRDGVESARRDRDDATGAITARRGLYADGATAWSAAAFADARWQRGRLLLDLGARFNHHQIRATDATFGRIDVSPHALVGSVSAAYEITQGQRVFLSVGEGFRAPNVDDLSTLGLFDFGVEVPSPHLRPERARSYEVGWKARSRRMSATAAAYRMDLRDLIDRVADTYQGRSHFEGERVYRRQNVGRAYVQGLEAEVEWQPAAELTAFGALTYTYGQSVSAGEPLRRIPPLNGAAGLRWGSARRLGLEGRLRFAARQDRLATGDRADHRIAPGGTPGFSVASVRGWYAVRRGVALVAGIENVFDEAYRLHGSGIDGPGRSVWLSTQVRF